MKIWKGISGVAILLVLAVNGIAQKPEVAISLNEAFFDSLLDAVFQNAPPLEFSIGSLGDSRNAPRFTNASFTKPDTVCKEVIQLLRENNGVRSSVRFRDGKIYAPLAFSGNYNPPLVGCVPFAGTADTVIDLEFDQPNQRLVARAKVQNVALNGTGGVGGSLIARLVQGSIDKKINPIEVFRLDKLSFAVPVNGASLKMTANGVRHEVVNGEIRIFISYAFGK
jgi:hypothetical protein